MSRPDPFQRRPVRTPEPVESAPPLIHRLVLIGAAVLAMLAAARVLQRSAESVPVPEEAVAIGAPAAIMWEAQVFRTDPATLSFGAKDRRRPDAHPRTLATYRLLRSYPGAPPRVPHGLTSTEFRTNRCNTCHERGGYSQRFNAYTPVNPHPELESCLQCHATNALLVGVPFPEASSDEACRQCHSGAPARFEEEGLTWRTTSFPAIGSGRPGEVPVIPHELQMRGNCLTCHLGPGAVTAIRTTHPERANCRQCHVTVADDAATFTRPLAAAERTAGGAR